MKTRKVLKDLAIVLFFVVQLHLTLSVAYATESLFAGWSTGSSWDDDEEGPAPSYGTILRSTDSGATWVRQGSGQLADVNFNGVFAVTPYTAWVVGDQESGYGTVYYTTDGGKNWVRKGSPNQGSANFIPAADLLKVHANANDVWIVGSPGTILHSSDAGASWTQHIPQGYQNIQFQGVYALDSKTVWVTGGPDNDTKAVILKSTDAGLNWIRLPESFDPDPEYILGISAADSETAWAVGHTYVILKTDDGGTTWKRHPDFGGLGDINEVCAVNKSTLWVATDNEIVWSTDGGETWGHSMEHGVSGAIAFMGISAISDKEAWGAYNGYDHDKKVFFGFIVSTMDGGNTWTKTEKLNNKTLPGMSNISFASQPINSFSWPLFTPAFIKKERKDMESGGTAK